MTINRRWIAREWLYLLAGSVWAYVLSPILVPPLARVMLWIFPIRLPAFGGVGAFIGFGLYGFGPYVIFQLARITMWAIHTLREGGAVRD